MLLSLKSLIVSSIVLSASSAMLPSAIAADWVAKPATIKPRSEASAIQYRDDVYVFNGFGPNIRIEDTIEKYSAATGQWQIVGSTSVAKGNAVTHNGIIRHGSDVWLIGGRIGSHPGKVSNQVWIYNLNTQQWRRGTDLPVPVAAGGAAIVNNSIHWVGGLDSNASCDVNHHFVYDLSEPALGWQDLTPVAPMPFPRNHFATVQLGESFYVIGGQFGHDACPGRNADDQAFVHSFDTTTNQWQRHADLPVGNSHSEPSTFVHKGYIYVVGGQISMKKVERFDPLKNIWETVATLPQALLAPVARVVDGKLIVAAGGAPTARNPTTLVRSLALSLPNATGNAAIDSSSAQSDESNSSAQGQVTTSPVSESVAAGESLIIVEAEYHDMKQESSSHEWRERVIQGVSNDNAMITFPDNGALRKSSADSPMLSFFVAFDRPGKHYLWIRGSGDTNARGEGRSDSLHAGLNGQIAASADKIEHFPATLSWSDRTRDNARAVLDVPSAGIHAVNLWMREDGLLVDKFILTSDPDFVPVGSVESANVQIDGSSTQDSDAGNTTDQPLVETLDEPIGQTGIDETNDVVDANDSSNQTTGSQSGNGEQSAGAGSKLVVVEAENATANIPAGTLSWVAGNRSGSVGGSMTTSSDRGVLKLNENGSPQINYQVTFNSAGTYRVWVRAWGDTRNGEGRSDSLHVGLNGRLLKAKAIQNFPVGQWHWSNSTRSGVPATIEVAEAGTHTVNVWMREDGLEVDRLLFTTDTAFEPSDSGPHQNTPASPDPITNPPVEPEEDDTETMPDPHTDTPTESDTSDVASISGTITIEAEDYQASRSAQAHEWIAVNRSGSMGGSMVSAPNVGTLRFSQANSPVLEYRVHFAEAGTYAVWIRGWGDTRQGEGRNDSVHVGVNGNLSTAKAIQNFSAGQWHWSNQTRGNGIATLTVPSAGTHTINVWMREDGFEFDRLVLSNVPGYMPQITVEADVVDDGTHENSSVADGSDDSRLSIDASADWQRHSGLHGSSVIARHEAGGVAHKGKLYVIGGKFRESVSVFDPVLGSWQQKSAPPIELHHFQPVVWNDQIWIVGAYTGNYPDETPVQNIYTYTPSTDVWKKQAMIPATHRRGGAGAVVYKDKIYLVGGNIHGHRAGSQTWFDEYNPQNNQWRSLPDAPVARDHVTVAVASDQLVVAGGRQSRYPDTFGNMLAQTDVFDFNTGRWSVKGDIPTLRAGTMTVAVGNEIVVIGGESKSLRIARDSVEAFNVDTFTWRQLKSLSVGRHSGAAAVLQEKIHVVSGSEKRGGAPQSTVHETLMLIVQ